MQQDPTVIAWLKTERGEPVPVHLHTISSVNASGHPQIVEKIVSFPLNEFPWQEVEALAIALATHGFHLVDALEN